MLIARGRIRYTFLIPIAILMLICSLTVHKTAGSSFNGYEVPIYKMITSENNQRDIWKLCEENHLSYELVLAVFYIDGVDTTQIDNIKAEIEKLANHRDYWTGQGFPDEDVFDLMLLSRDRGIEGCKIFMNDSDSYHLDDYVQKVTEYKYYLEQIDGDSVNKSLQV